MKKEFDRFDDYDDDSEQGMGCAYAFLICIVFWGLAYWIFA